MAFIMEDLGVSIAQVSLHLTRFMTILDQFNKLKIYFGLYSFINMFSQFSLFGSLLTFGGMIGAIFSASISDSFGRKMVRYLLVY